MRAFLILGLLALGGCAATTPDAERTMLVPAPAVGAREPQVRSSGGLDIILGGRLSVDAQAR
jgi:hypothetical protein